MSMLKTVASSRALRVTAAMGIAGAALVGLATESAQAAVQTLKLSSSTGPDQASTVLSVTGKGFIDNTGTVVVGTVEFQSAACGAQGANNAAAAAAKSVVSDSRLVITTPNTMTLSAPNTKTDWYLCVYDTSGTPVLLGSAKYTLYPAPAITATISPTSGPSAGGGTVTITGTGFTAKSTVKFGSVASPKVTVNTAGTKILATIPAQAATGSAVSVVVTTEGGADTVTTPGDDQFTYKNAIAVSPQFGKNATATTISVTGVGFSSLNAFGTTAGKSAVAFVPSTWTPAQDGPTGTAAAPLCTNPQLVSDTEIVCDTPNTVSDKALFVTVVKDIDKTKASATAAGASVVSGSAAFTFAAF